MSVFFIDKLLMMFSRENILRSLIFAAITFCYIGIMSSLVEMLEGAPKIIKVLLIIFIGILTAAGMLGLLDFIFNFLELSY